jgi:hypothetical protein
MRFMGAISSSRDTMSIGKVQIRKDFEERTCSRNCFWICNKKIKDYFGN